MDTESVKTKFVADVTGFTAPLDKAMRTVEQMTARLEKMGRAGDQAAAQAAEAAKSAAGIFGSVMWNSPLGKGNTNDVGNWLQHLAQAADLDDKTRRVLSGLARQRQREQRATREENEQQARVRRASRVRQSLSGQQTREGNNQQRETRRAALIRKSLNDQREREQNATAAANESERQRRVRVLGSLSRQRSQEQAKAARSRAQQANQARQQRRRANQAQEQQRAATVRQFGRAGLAGGTGFLAGLASGNPLTGLAGGALGGAFIGGPAGAVAGASLGLVGGVIGMGGHLLSGGLEAAVELTKNLVVETVKLGMEYQRNVAYFQAFTGSKASSLGIMGQLQDIAVGSPFKFNQLTGPASLLMGYGIDPGQIPAAVGRLAMVAGGDPERLQRLSLAYAQVQSHGQFMGQELRQFAEAGVGAPDFAKTMGLSTAQFKGQMHAGAVGSDVVTKTINRLTGPGGRYQDVNAELLNTVEGRVNQLVETVQIKLGKAGAAMFEKFDIGGKIEGITAGIGPFVDVWLPKIEDGLTHIFEVGGYVFDPLIKNIQSLIGAGRDFWNGPIGKMFLPQTWDQFQTGALSAGMAMAMLTGTLMDSVQVTAAAATGLIGLATNDMSLVAKSLMIAGQATAAPNHYLNEMTAPWVRATINAAKDKQLGGGNSWSWLPKGPGGIGPAIPELASVTPYLSSQQSKFIESIRGTGEYGKGGDKGESPLDKFYDAIRKISGVSASSFKLGPGIGAMGGGFAGSNGAALLGLLTDPEAEMARYAAYQTLKHATHMEDHFRLPTGAMADTAEAVKVALESSAMPSEMDPQERIRQVLEAAKKEAEKQTKELEELNKFFKDNPTAVVKKKVG